MKKIYALIVVVTCFYAKGIAQDTYTWVGGGADNKWSTAGNWSGPNNEPFDGDIVLFNGNQAINIVMDVDIVLQRIRVEGTAGINVNIVGDDPDRTIFITDATSALTVAANNILRLNSVILSFEPNAKGTVNGTLSLEGNDGSDCAIIDLLSDFTQLSITNGATLVSKASNVSFLIDIDGRLRLESGSILALQELDPAIPFGYFHPTSEIIVSGLVNNSLSFDEGAGADIGKLTFNCPLQNRDDIFLNLPHGIQIRGDLNIENTNNRTLSLMANSGGSTTDRTVTIEGNLNISGTSKVALATAFAVATKTYTAVVLGSANIGGTSFSLQDGNVANIDPSILVVKGNINHTAGEFKVNSSITSTTRHLYTVEMNGDGAQIINSHNGIFDNGTGQLTLKINNGSGVTASSSLQAGRISFVNGILNMGASQVLTLTNTSNNSLVVENPAAGRYVNGAIRRTVTGTNELVFALGTGGGYRPVSIFPQTNETSVYEVGVVNGMHSDPSTLTPVSGLAPYYFNINRISGADAIARLTLSGAVPGAQAADALIAVRYNGTDWLDDAAPLSRLNGTATSGNLNTRTISGTSLITIGYALQAALPTNLVNFTVKKIGSSAQLSWKITDNSTPEIFEVLRSTDGAQFNLIGEVAGFGTKLTYEYLDNSLAAGNNYYRLRMIDKDGVITLSSIVAVMNGTKGVLINALKPTMVTDRARLSVSSSEQAKLQLVVTDVSGRIVLTQQSSITAGNQEIWLNAAGLQAGLFHVTGYINGEKTATFRFFKQ